MVSSTVRIRCDRLEALQIDLFGSAGSDLDGIRSEIGDQTKATLEHLIKSILNRLVLLSSLSEACFENETNELIDVFLSDIAVLASITE